MSSRRLDFTSRICERPFIVEPPAVTLSSAGLRKRKLRHDPAISMCQFVGLMLPTAGRSAGLTSYRHRPQSHFRARRLPQENQRPGDSNGPLSPDSPRCTWRLSVLHLICWMIALATYEPGAAEATDWMKPPCWSGNYWGPAATRARSAGNLPPLQSNPEMDRWHRWGREVLRQGDIVFRLGDARVVRGMVPLSRFIARATGSPFSHTGIVAIEDGSPVVYDCSSAGVQRQPFEIWMLDSLGALGVKRSEARAPRAHRRSDRILPYRVRAAGSLR